MFWDHPWERHNPAYNYQKESKQNNWILSHWASSVNLTWLWFIQQESLNWRTSQIRSVYVNVCVEFSCLLLDTEVSGHCEQHIFPDRRMVLGHVQIMNWVRVYEPDSIISPWCLLYFLCCESIPGSEVTLQDCLQVPPWIPVVISLYDLL